MPRSVPRDLQRQFWRLIAEGMSTHTAGRLLGVPRTTSDRWFGKAGGMPPLELSEPSSRYLSLAEREEIAILHAQRLGPREIGRRLGRSASTISRETRRNAQRAHRRLYRATGAHARAEARARRPKVAKLVGCERLRAYVQEQLTGQARWSPEQIANRVRVDFPDDETMRISHEAIYQSLYIQGRGALRRELTACLRTGRAVRKPRRRAGARTKRQIPAELMISQRPAEVEDRAVPGHWEGDLIIGTQNGSAIGTLVERTTRFAMLLHLPGEHGGEAVRDAIAATILTLPEQLRRTLTWDQGAEMSQHAQIRIDTDVEIYFCDPHSPWQRGTNENTNGLLRQYFPKGTDLEVHGSEDLIRVAAGLNARPRKALGWKTPAEALNELLSAAT